MVIEGRKNVDWSFEAEIGRQNGLTIYICATVDAIEVSVY